MLQRALSLIALVFLAVSGLSAQDTTSYAVRPGDRVTVQVFTAAGERVDVVGGQRIIDRTGDIFLPYVGTVHVAGLDEMGLRDLLTRRYGSFYSDPVVDVKVELRVNVTGAVGHPGQYFLDPTATLVDAVATAGGMASEYAVTNVQIAADQSRVRLVRNGRSYTVNLRPSEVADSVLLMRIRSGDWIHVPARERSRVRDNVQFWGSVLSFVASFVGLIYLIGH